MKAAILALAILLTGCEDVEVRVKSATVQIEAEQAGGCSGTFIGPSILLSASHCFPVESGMVMIGHTPANIVSMRKDAGDTVIVVLDYQHPAWAKLGKRPKQGDRLFYYGNPEGLSDLLRRGYVVGENERGILLDMAIGGGDSGAGLFNERGEVVGVVSGVYHPRGFFHIGLTRPISDGFLE